MLAKDHPTTGGEMAEEKKTPPQNKSKKRTRRKPLSLHPLAVDEALAISLGAGRLPEKRPKKDSRHRATTTPTSKPMKGKK
jgi:hypothetical protein